MITEDIAEHSLEPLTRLLRAHAALIRETSEDMAVGLVDAFDDLRQIVGSIDMADEDAAQLKDRINKMSANLQLQDFLRQQVIVLEQGLLSIAKARVPAGETPAAWYHQTISKIEAAYVMQAQYTVHANALDLPEKQVEEEEDTLFF